ncbi:tetratricopeptide repeat protein [Vannielia litorea]|uniref:tetratricopeptide repeat protein n=1 Tax=Vannielia TaxID=2813041 RepID=UPI001C95F920|nr:tetratricopeptide repeat protein [Vannielia litorea]MBY6046297.1 tetratricopeptide repeat protein [Vannielia litorea]MBY6073710.1 tetratricopeptide repeat protein [Vannielia litorea]MBY6153816.1 tetratricopeptide repeat protein [Vannielia litorea]
MVSKWLIPALMAATPLAAERCDMEVLVEPDKREAVLQSVRDAGSEREARAHTNEMWEIWSTAPDARAQELLDEGLDRREAYDFEGAIKAFDALVDYCPSYAEGYNQRAFIRFMQQDYAPALTDLDAAITRAPDHFAAIAGKALTLMGLGRNGEAKTALEEALDLNPWLPERGLMPMLENQDI